MTLNDPGGNRKRIFLVDDHPLVREWLGHLINRQTDLALCGEAQERRTPCARSAGARPMLWLSISHCVGSSGIELIAEIKLAFPKVADLGSLDA